VFLYLKIIYDVEKHQKKIKKGIKKYGHFDEHNLIHYLNYETNWDKNILFDFGKDRIVLTQFYKVSNIWSLFPNGVLAPKDERLELFLKVNEYVFDNKKPKKFVVEVSQDLRKEIMDKFDDSSRFRICKSTDVLYWPMYNMKVWDSKLRGSRWKKLRNVKNRFYKNNKIRISDSKDVPHFKLKKILSNWLKKRKDNDRVEKEYYFNLINNSFKGMDIAKTIYINGKPCTITAGWKIPNTNNYYSSIGILDYSHPGLGELSNIDDLNRLKKKGYDYVDFGGSDKVLLEFKKKFKPEKIYKTYTFSIVRNDKI